MYHNQFPYKIIFSEVVASGVDASGIRYELHYEIYSDNAKGMATYCFINGEWRC
jgi:hypothetical protein